MCPTCREELEKEKEWYVNDRWNKNTEKIFRFLFVLKALCFMRASFGLLRGPQIVQKFPGFVLTAPLPFTKMVHSKVFRPVFQYSLCLHFQCAVWINPLIQLKIILNYWRGVDRRQYEVQSRSSDLCVGHEVFDLHLGHPGVLIEQSWQTVFLLSLYTTYFRLRLTETNCCASRQVRAIW
jgi:hypothetical protein